MTAGFMKTFGSCARAIRSRQAASICGNRPLAASSTEIAVRCDGACQTAARASAPLLADGAIGGVLTNGAATGIAALLSVIVVVDIVKLISAAGAK
jgi:hypothetical protein